MPGGLTVASLNVTGWTSNNCALRQQILATTKADIICIQETHADRESDIVLDGYVFYSFNRAIVHKNAPHNFGGVGIFIQNNMFNFFNVKITDRTYDGILCINLLHKITEYDVSIFCCYLPPVSSPYGRNSASFYSHLLC